MTEDTQISRRRLVVIAGSTTLATGLAGCTGGETTADDGEATSSADGPVDRTGADTVTVDTVNIMVSGTGDARTDGRNIAREFERALSDRGA